jgi:16S rRNA (guanine(966)-N(2))-methyltransferase RsmD
MGVIGLRVITGTAKGRSLKTLRGQATRPTTELLRGALFNIIGDAICDRSFLDLYAGSGAVGIEALSRGATRAVFIDESAEAVRVIGDNLRSTGFSGVGQAFTNTVRAAIEILGRRGQQFDFIFLDPPYEKGWIALTLGWLAKTPLLAPDGAIIVEHSRREPITGDLFAVRREASHGDSRLTFLAGKEDV